MHISIIICTRNRAKHLAGTLRSVASLDVPSEKSVEVVLVDNASTDATWSVMSSFRPSQFSVVQVREPQRGAANARNTGIRSSQGDILLFTDDDVRLPKNWIGVMIAPIEDGIADVVQGSIQLAPHLDRPWMDDERQATRLAQVEQFDLERPTLTSANFAISRSVLRFVPQFDPAIGPGRLGFEEDRLFGKQLHLSGALFAFVDNCPVVHHCDASRLSRTAYLDDAEKLGRSTAYVRYHWNHEYDGVRQSWPWLFAKLARAYLRLWMRRLTHWSEWQEEEGMMRWELRSLMNVFVFRQLLSERGRERMYATPHALVRRDIDLQQSTTSTEDNSLPNQTADSGP